MSASIPSVSAGSVFTTLTRFLGAAAEDVASTASPPSPSVAALPLAFLGVDAILAGSKVAPPKSFFLRLSQEAFADLPLVKTASRANFSVSI